MTMTGSVAAITTSTTTTTTNQNDIYGRYFDFLLELEVFCQEMLGVANNIVPATDSTSELIALRRASYINPNMMMMPITGAPTATTTTTSAAAAAAAVVASMEDFDDDDDEEDIQDDHNHNHQYTNLTTIMAPHGNQHHQHGTSSNSIPMFRYLPKNKWSRRIVSVLIAIVVLMILSVYYWIHAVGDTMQFEHSDTHTMLNRQAVLEIIMMLTFCTFPFAQPLHLALGVHGRHPTTQQQIYHYKELLFRYPNTKWLMTVIWCFIPLQALAEAFVFWNYINVNNNDNDNEQHETNGGHDVLNVDDTGGHGRILEDETMDAIGDSIGHTITGTSITQWVYLVSCFPNYMMIQLSVLYVSLTMRVIVTRLLSVDETVEEIEEILEELHNNNNNSDNNNGNRNGGIPGEQQPLLQAPPSSSSNNNNSNSSSVTASLFSSSLSMIQDKITVILDSYKCLRHDMHGISMIFGPRMLIGLFTLLLDSADLMLIVFEEIQDKLSTAQVAGVLLFWMPMAFGLVVCFFLLAYPMTLSSIHIGQKLSILATSTSLLLSSSLFTTTTTTTTTSNNNIKQYGDHDDMEQQQQQQNGGDNITDSTRTASIISNKITKISTSLHYLSENFTIGSIRFHLGNFEITPEYANVVAVLFIGLTLIVFGLELPVLE